MSKYAFFTKTALLSLLVLAICLIAPCASWANEAKAKANAGQAATSLPAGFRLTPLPNEAIAELRPVIKVRYPKGTKLDFTSVRLWVNGSEVSGNCLRAPHYVSYQPFVDMPDGQTKVKFSGKKADDPKQTISFEWSFDLQMPQAIKSITHNCDHDMGYLEDIVVQAESIPGGTAWFSLEGIADDISMTESVPGKYEGRYKIKLNDNKMQSHLTVYVKANGHQYSRTLDKTVFVCGSIFTITIFEPQQNDLVPLSFKIKGHTRPKSIIYLQPKIGLSEGMNTSSNDRNQASLGSIPAYADEKGDFEMEYGFPILLPNMQASLRFQAVDEEGNKSLPKSVWVKFK